VLPPCLSRFPSPQPLPHHRQNCSLVYFSAPAVLRRKPCPKFFCPFARIARPAAQRNVQFRTRPVIVDMLPSRPSAPCSGREPPFHHHDPAINTADVPPPHLLLKPARNTPSVHVTPSPPPPLTAQIVPYPSLLRIACRMSLLYVNRPNMDAGTVVGLAGLAATVFFRSEASVQQMSALEDWVRRDRQLADAPFPVTLVPSSLSSPIRITSE